MAEADLKKAGGITGAIDISDRCTRLLGQLCVAGGPIDPRAIRALAFLTDSVDVSGSLIDVSDRCARLLGQLCFGGVPIDPRQIRALAFLTDSVDVSGSSVDVTDRCARLLGQLCSGGVAIDPRQIRNLVFATDKVDVSGSSVTTASGSVTTMDDAFMELRLTADYLKDIPLVIDPSSSRVRTKIEESITLTATVATVTTVTNLAQIGNNPMNSFLFDEMDVVWSTGIMPQIV